MYSLISKDKSLDMIVKFNSSETQQGEEIVKVLENLFNEGEKITLKGGFLTEYGQYPAPANNHELFYHLQGFSDVGDSYIVAIFPITVLGLNENSDPASAIDGVAYPNMGDANADWKGYYGAATILLDATSPDAFTPSISQLDSLIQSIWVTP